MESNDFSVSYKENVSDGKIYKLDCSECKRKTNHTVKKSYREAWSVNDEGLAGLNDYTVVQCNGCDVLHFCKISSSNDDMEPIFDEKGNLTGVEYPDTFTLYPAVFLKYEPMLTYRSIPEDVRKVYRETFSALEAGLTKLSAIGIRTTLEQICIAKKIPSTLKLNKKIDKLYKNSIINDDMKNLLHKVRIFGNSSAHESSHIHKADLLNAWASINSLIRYIYGTEDQRNYFLNKDIKNITPD